MNYFKLGKLPNDTIEFFKEEIYKRRDPNRNYQWVEFDNSLNQAFMEIFENKDLDVMWDPYNNKWIQKAFFSAPGHGFKIHKDGTRCRSALNIAIQANDLDWTRFYDDDYINSISKTELNLNSGKNAGNTVGSSRNVDIEEYEDIEYVDELKTETGDVYLINVDKFHSFKCNGPNDRIIIQTKFKGFPDFNTIYETLKKKSFKNLIQ